MWIRQMPGYIQCGARQKGSSYCSCKMEKVKEIINNWFRKKYYEIFKYVIYDLC